MTFVDTHCHLADPKAFPDPKAAVQEAEARGVKTLVVVGVDTQTSRQALDLADQFPNVYAVVGFHPTHVATFTPQDLKDIEELARHPKAVAIGEIGLDYYWDYTTPGQQHRALQDQLDLAESLRKPVVFHCRDAYPQLLDVLESRPPRPYLLHCFAGNLQDADRAIALGCLCGVDGPVSYKSADLLRAVLRHIGLPRLVLETDSPYMAPVPHRGKPNRPAYIPEINQALAQALQETPQHTAQTTTANAQAFFHLPNPD